MATKDAGVPDARAGDAGVDVFVGGVDAAYGVFIHPDAGDAAGDASDATPGDAADAGDTTDARHDTGQGGAAYGVFTNPDGGF